MLGYDSYSRDELEDMLDKERAKVKDLEKQIEDMKNEEHERSVEKGMEIRRLRRSIIKMFKLSLSVGEEMYSRLDSVHGLDDDDVMNWEKVSTLRENLNKVLEKWK